MAVAAQDTDRVSALLARHGDAILEMVGEAIDASTAEQAPLIASAGLPTGDLAVALGNQIAELTALRTRLLGLLALQKSGRATADDLSLLEADILHALKCARIVVFDLVLNGMSAQMPAVEVVRQAAKMATLDAIVRTELVPALSLAVSAAS